MSLFRRQRLDSFPNFSELICDKICSNNKQCPCPCNVHLICVQFDLRFSCSNNCFENYGKFSKTSVAEFIFDNVMDLMYNFKISITGMFEKTFILKNSFTWFLDKKGEAKMKLRIVLISKKCGFSVCWCYCCFFLSFATAANQAPIPFVRPTIHPVGTFSYFILTHFSSMLISMETSSLIWTGVYMESNTELKWVKWGCRNFLIPGWAEFKNLHSALQLRKRRYESFTNVHLI